MLRQPTLWLIRLYQKTLSPDHGWFRARFPYGYCRFYPSCSEYACQSIEKFGLVKGVLKGSWRILRCNPWSRGGLDPVVIPEAPHSGAIRDPEIKKDPRELLAQAGRNRD